MWTAKDSDNIVDYQAAKAYCEALELGGLKQWRLPTIRELPGLYDPSNTRASNKGLAFGEGKLPYHIKPYIELHNPLIWSSDQWFRDEWSSVQPGNESAYLFNFQTGRTAADRFNSKRTLENGQYLAHHALCVRRFNPDNDAGPDAPQPAGGPRNQQDSLPAQATDSTDAKKVAQRAKVIARFRKDCDMGGPPGCFLLGKAYMEGDGVPKDTQMALEFLDKSCSLGEHKGCTYAAQLRQH
jgi:TPR repeat protein